MKNYAGMCCAWLISFLFGAAPPAAAEPIVVQARLVREDGRPITAAEVRVVVGSEGQSRSPTAGKVLKTDGGGRIRYAVEAPIKKRSIKLDSVFARHESQLLEVGLELKLLDRRVLYWVELDLVKAGALAGMKTFVPGKSGAYDLPLKFHPASHSWTFPDQPNGMHLTSTGVRLVEHDLKKSAAGVWSVDLVLEKQEFSVR